jgi:hypothetical protein
MMTSCNKNQEEMPDHRYGYGAEITYNILIDSTQERLDSNANPGITPSGHGSLSPRFNYLQINQIYLFDSASQDDGWSTLYNPLNITGSNGTTTVGSRYDGSKKTLNCLKISFSFQNYELGCSIDGNYLSVNMLSFFSGSHLGQDSLFIRDSVVYLDTLKSRGEWYLEIDSVGMGAVLHRVTSTLTAPTILHNTNPLEDGAYSIICAITPPLTFTGDQKHTVNISISSNHCFEWIEHSNPGSFEPLNGDTVFDFGLRGAQVTW